MDDLNNTFTDFAWGEMEQLLDKEMPVKRKKRRFPILFLFLLGIGTGIALSAAYFRYAYPANVMTKASLAYTQNQPTTNKENCPESSDIIANSSLSNTNTKSIIATTKTLRNTQNAKPNTSFFIKKAKALGAQVMLSTINENLRNTRSNKENKADNQIDRTTIKRYKTINIPSLSINYLQTEQNPIASTASTIFIKNINPIKWGLRIGAGHNLQQLWQVQGGGFMQWHFNKKLFVETGLNYVAIQDHKFTTQAESLQDIFQDTSTPNTGGSAGDTEDTNTSFINNNEKNIQNTKRHLVELPLLVGYQFNKKLEAFAGIHLSYNFAVNKLDDLHWNHASIAIPSNDFNVGTMIGYRYMFSANFGLELAYQREFMPYFSYPNGNKYYRQDLRFSLIGRF